MPDKKEIHRIFDHAAEIESVHERQIYLDGACGKFGKLRTDVESLLGASELADDFLEGNPIARVSLEKIDTNVGPYELRECIGEGGMGIVYVAEGLESNTGKVALKIIKPGMDSKQVIARFEAERQTLALMDHPNIAKVLDAGATENGRPYFAMELVRGLPITAYCDKHARPTRQRLELFVAICNAVQHAHEKGIIHRDIKPGNLLVARDGDREIPKVIDFGVAKATQHQFTKLGVYTRFHQVIGTPLYMSPEQTDPGELEIDFRSDVYSLGVVLYELLTGTTPIQKEHLDSIGFDEVRRIIRDEDPARPSDRIRTLAADGESTLIERHRSDHQRIDQRLARELDWIVMRALEKDRNRRYESVGALATDIQRFLDDKPVVARPPSASYKLRKFAGRNRMLLSAAGLVLLTLTLGIAGTSWQAIRATRERDEKIEALKKSEANLDLARTTIDELHRQIDLENSSPDESFIRKALELSHRLAKSLDEQGDLPHAAEVEFDRIADMHHAIGEDKQAATALEKSLKIQKGILTDEPRNLDQLHDAANSSGKLAIAKILTADGDGANAAIQQGREYFKEVAESGATKMKLPLALFPMVEAAMKICLGEFEEADQLSNEAEKAASSLNAKNGLPDLAFIVQSAKLLRVLSLLARGRYDDAKTIATNSLTTCKRLIAANHPDSEELSGLAAAFCVSLFETAAAANQYVEARDCLRRALRFSPDDAEANHCLSGLLANCIQADLRDPAKAVAFGKKAVSVAPNEPDYHNGLGVALYRNGNYREAIAALESFKEITGERDGINGFVSAMAHHQLGHSNISRQLYDKAVKWMNDASPKDEELVRFRAEAETQFNVHGTSSPPNN